MYRIEDLPIPAVAGYTPRRDYPFASLDVGQSFIVPAVDAVKPKSLRHAAWRAGRDGRSFGVSRLSDGSFQVWRKR